MCLEVVLGGVGFLFQGWNVFCFHFVLIGHFFKYRMLKAQSQPCPIFQVQIYPSLQSIYLSIYLFNSIWKCPSHLCLKAHMSQDQTKNTEPKNRSKKSEALIYLCQASCLDSKNDRQATVVFRGRVLQGNLSCLRFPLCLLVCISLDIFSTNISRW